jgi:UDP-N-acetylmuramoylalanine-D-glutamate ligase
LVTTERHGTTIMYRLNMSVMEEAFAAFLAITGTKGKER